ncbi:MAG: hypothetical protein WC848_01870 [Parcubacteria group bacterium]|jgi:hypothetical protein
MKKDTFKKLAYLSSFLALFFGATHFASAAGIVPCGTGANDPCTLCHLIIGIKNLMDWGMTIIITLAITAICIAGVILIVSSGDPKLTTQGKSFITSAVIGFALTLGAWLIVNVTLWIFSAKSGTGGYNLGLEQDKNWHSFTCSTTSTATTK